MHSAGMDRSGGYMQGRRSSIDARGALGGMKRHGRAYRPRGASQPRKESVVAPKKVLSAVVLLSIAGMLAVLLVPAQQSSAHSDNTGGGCDACHPSTATSFLVITGLPSTTYTPGTPYTITIQTTDSNGATGRNAFDFIVNGGTVTSSDPNVAVAAGNLEAHTLVDTVASWTVVWTAPSSGTVQVDTWGVWGGGSRTTSPWNHDSRALSSGVGIPEFPTLILPIVGAAGIVVVLAKVSRKKTQ